MVSLREGQLKLLALRGLFAIDGTPHKSLVLAPGQVISLARGVSITVLDVHLPPSVVGLQGGGLSPQPLSGVCGLHLAPTPYLEPGVSSRAAATFWSTGDGWRVRVGSEPATDLEPGWSVELGEHTFSAVAVALRDAGAGATRNLGGVDPALRIVCQWDVVHIHREGHPTLHITCYAAQLISELASLGAPVSWEVLADQIWDDGERYALRRRWDVLLARLRRKLRGASVRTDLVHPDGQGNVELLLRPGDSVDDRS